MFRRPLCRLLVKYKPTNTSIRHHRFFFFCDLPKPIKRFPPPPHSRDCLRLSAEPRECKRPLVCLNLPPTQCEWNRCSHSSNDFPRTTNFIHLRFQAKIMTDIYNC
jgi:hypothetical protein